MEPHQHISSVIHLLQNPFKFIDGGHHLVIIGNLILIFAGQVPGNGRICYQNMEEHMGYGFHIGCHQGGLCRLAFVDLCLDVFAFFLQILQKLDSPVIIIPCRKTVRLRQLIFQLLLLFFFLFQRLLLPGFFLCFILFPFSHSQRHRRDRQNQNQHQAAGYGSPHHHGFSLSLAGSFPASALQNALPVFLAHILCLLFLFFFHIHSLTHYRSGTSVLFGSSTVAASNRSLVLFFSPCTSFHSR